MKKTLILPLTLLAGVTCFSIVQGTQKVEAKVPATYESNIKPVNIYLEDDAKIYLDNYLYKMVDGDTTTNVWFNGRTSGIVLDYGKNFLLHDVYIFSGKVEGGDHFYSTIESSLDGVTWTTLDSTGDYSGEFTFDYFSNPVETRYLRLRDLDTESGNWAAITEFGVNKIEKRVSYNNLELEDAAYGHSNPTDMIDDDGTTFTWFKYQTLENRELILSYNKAQEVSYIELLTSKVDSKSDYIGTVKFYYAVDDSYEWIEIDGTYNGVAIRAILDTPVMAKHVKALAEEARAANGLVVREFSTSTNSPVSLENYKEYTSQRNPSYYTEQMNSIRNLTDGSINSHVDLQPIDTSLESGVIYDLDIVKNVTSVTLVSNAPWGDEFESRPGTILSSIDGINYTDITNQFTYDSETGTYTLVDANIVARYIKLGLPAGSWVGLSELTVESEDLTNTSALAKFGGQFSIDYSTSNFGLRFLIPVLEGTNIEDYKVICSTGSKEVIFNKETNSTNLISTTDGNLQLTVGLGDIINDYEKLVTEFTVSGYYVNENSYEGLTGSISYSIESIVREYLYLNVINSITLNDTQVEFLTNLNSRIQDLSKTATIEA